jgi:nucleoside-diphosphate-sugar epimerase
MIPMGHRVLVTGGAGYLGSILCEHLLNAGCEVTVIDNLSYQQHSLFHLCANSRLELVLGDVRDENLMHRLVRSADVLIPLAAIVGVPACDLDPWLAQSVNLEAVQLVNRLRCAGQLIIYPSTESGYGDKSGGVRCTEDTPLEPVSHYARTKVRAEAELLESPNVITLRLATVFGMSPRMRLDLLVNYFVYAAVTDGCIVIFEKDVKRNYVHIRDVADCIIHCIDNAPRMVGRPYNVGFDAANISKQDLALKIKQHIPNFYIHFAPVGSDPDKRNYTVSNERLREAGFKAQRSLDEGIQELVKGYQMIGRLPFKNV